MVPLGSWLFISFTSALLSFLLAWFDGNGRIGDGTWTKVWLGSRPREVAERALFGSFVLFVMLLNSAGCGYECEPWLALTATLLYLLALVGWPVQSILFSIAYIFLAAFWREVLGIDRGVGSTFFHFLIFLLNIAFVLIHLRQRVPMLRRVPLPPVVIELGDRMGRALTPVPRTDPLPDVIPISPKPRARSVAVPTRTLAAPIAASSLYLRTLLIEGLAALVRSGVYFLASLFLLSPLYILLLVTTRNMYMQRTTGFLGGGNLVPDYGAWLLGNTGTYFMITALVGFAFGSWPLLRSLFHMAFPYTRSGDGEQEQEALGAREPTRTEHQKIIDALETIHASAGTQTVAAPSKWLVIDAPVPDAYTIGSTVYLARAAIEDSHLAGIMAHELGHIAHQDGDVVLALRRFIIPLAYFVGIDRQPMPAGAVLTRGSNIQLDVIRNDDEKTFYRFKALQIKLGLAFWCGGLGMFFLGRQWARFWRARDFLADDYAVQLGQADSLMGILKTYRHVDMAQPFLLTNRPYTAERLDRLEG
jgi:Zn-dependent protease with chaperone function